MFTCKYNHRVFRHDCVASVLTSMLRSVSAVPRKASKGDEWVRGTPENGLTGEPGDNIPDLVVKLPEQNRLVNIDFAMRDCFGNPPGSAFTAMHSTASKIRQEEQNKDKKHKAGSAELGRNFVGYVTHTLGGHGPQALAFVKQLRDIAKDQSADRMVHQQFASFWLAVLSVRFQRDASDLLSKAKAVGMPARFPSHTSSADGAPGAFDRHMLLMATSRHGHSAGRARARGEGEGARAPRLDVAAQSAIARVSH